MVEIDYLHNLLACMLFKDNEEQIVESFLGKKYSNSSELWKDWNRQARTIINRLRKKLSDLAVDVEEYQKLVLEYASIYPVNLKAFGRQTNTNTLLSALALVFAPDEIIKTAFDRLGEERTQKFFSTLIEEISFNVKEPDEYFWKDVLYVLGTRSGAYYPPNSVEYVSALKLGEPTRHTYLMEKKGYTASTDYFKVKLREYYDESYRFDAFVYQLSSVIDTFSLKNAYKFNSYEELFQRVTLFTVNLSCIEEKEKELFEFFFKNPHLTQKYVSAFYFGYELSKKNPVFYPFVKNIADKLGLPDLKEEKVLASVRPKPLSKKLKTVL